MSSTLSFVQVKHSTLIGLRLEHWGWCPWHVSCGIGQGHRTNCSQTRKSDHSTSLEHSLAVSCRLTEACYGWHRLCWETRSTVGGCGVLVKHGQLLRPWRSNLIHVEPKEYPRTDPRSPCRRVQHTTRATTSVHCHSILREL